VLQRRRRMSPDQPLSPDDRRLIQSLPYDPPDYSLEESALDVRSFHAPAFGPDGRVALVFVLVGFPRVTDLAMAQRHLNAVLDLAAEVTAMACADFSEDAGQRGRVSSSL
jgi:hypothetical protein